LYDKSSMIAINEPGSMFYFYVPHPRLWWCNGMGKPNLYEFTCEFTIGKQVISEKVAFGIRIIELAVQPDHFGTSFSFVLNDRPVFIKGASWIPADNFLPRVTTEKYYMLLKGAQESHMNMMRVWGGGVYEDDRFYNICDSLGIMVWQDFMFAEGMYPADLHFQQMVSLEVRQQFFRLSEHPSVSIWCGNSGSTDSWKNNRSEKGRGITPADSAKIVAGYNKLFLEEIRKIVKTADRNAIYWPASPTAEADNVAAFRNGDVQYRGVWWGMDPLKSYETYVGRFMSGYGFQALPSMISIREFAGNCNSLNDTWLKNHQKHPGGFERIAEYMLRDYPVPDTFCNYVYVSQLVQSDGISRAIQAHRRNRPYCMGTLFWQYNDCWPATSWSTVDYFGRPKLLQYALKELYAPVLVSVEEENDSVFVYIVNDDTSTHAGTISFRYMNFDGTILNEGQVPAVALHGTSSIPLVFKRSFFMDSAITVNGVLSLVFYYENEQTVRRVHYFDSPKNLQLPKNPGLKIIVTPSSVSGTFFISITTKQLAKSVYITLDGQDARFSENGFDLLPGEERIVTLTGDFEKSEIENSLVLLSLNALAN
ncbi:MAG TPA: glycoside hydrolase family 2 protein, partial [Bacteroidia bacterium]|nr:glycoside hydrolase family 2 protein [Bacteroidia bacterium]